MATMVLKDMVICPKCGAEMFPSAFDKDERKISYKCCNESCKVEIEYGFDEVKLKEDERFHYFCLNDDGDATWKCYEHGYCDFHIEGLLEMDFTKFARCCCILGRDFEDMEADAEYAHSKGKEIIKKILDAIGEERTCELADEILYEMPVDMFDGDYLEAFVAESICDMDGVESFISNMIDSIYDMFEISIDENGQVIWEE